MQIRAIIVVLVTLIFMSCGMSVFTTQSSDYTPKYPEELMLRLKGEIKGNGVSDDFAVIIGANTEVRHRGNISFTYQALIESGYQRKNIFILDTASRTPYFPKTDTTSIDAVRQLFWYLSAVVEKDDTLLVYVSGHGVRVKDQSYIKLNGKELMASEVFIEMLDALEPATGFMFMDHCYWGIELRPAGCQWVTLTVTRSNVTSKGTAFPRLFWAGVRDALSIQEAFEFAKENDPNTKSTDNRPKLFIGECTHKLALPIAIDRVISY